VKVRGLVFDFDGLIVDTETSSFETAREIYEEHGVTLTLAMWQDRIGAHGRPWYQDLEAVVGPLPARELIVERRRIAHHERVMAEVALPGVAAFVANAASAGLGLAVASSSTAGWVSEHLERLGLLGHFSVLSCWEEGVLAKPAPDLYKQAVAALGLEPADAIAFEDSPNGIAAAKAAGLRCIAVPNQVTADLDLSAADRVVPSFEDLAIDSLVLSP
jgi:HAD superfamily hydrolase (TIGR01509 family)